MKLSVLGLFFTGIVLFLPMPVFGQTTQPQTEQQQHFFTGRIITIEKQGKKTVGTSQNIFQTVQIQILNGPDRGKTVTLEHGGTFTLTDQQKVTVGDTVVLTQTYDQAAKKSHYSIQDKFRLDKIFYIAVGFFLFVLLVARRKGLGAILGMLFSIVIIFLFIVPQILNGSNPIVISIIGAILIMFVTLYLAHGFSQQTTIALGAISISLILTGIIASMLVYFAHLSGLGSEDAYTLQQGFKDVINFRGLLLGGIIIGTLGVLDDVTTTQVATIYTLAEANPKYSVQTLFRKGMNIGQAHIASLVNTLVLAYAGASIGIFIYLHLGIKNNIQPLWVILNSEVLTEEIVRTLAGSFGLILAVPITTLLAAFFAKHEVKIN